MIEIDIRSLAPPGVVAGIQPAVLETLVDDIADAARAKWIQVAHERLTTSEAEYVSNISKVNRLKGLAWIELTGAFPNMIEHGFDGFDLRETMLQSGSRGVKNAADGGRYRSIFFRRGAPTSGRRNFPRLTDLYARELGKAHGERLGSAVHRALKRLAPGEGLGAGFRARKSKTGPAVQAHALQRGQIAPSGHKVQHSHKTDLFAGTYHFVQQLSSGKSQSYFGSFRTISTNAPDGWVHPGYKPGVGAGITEEVNRYVGVVAPGMMAAVVQSQGAGGSSDV